MKLKELIPVIHDDTTISVYKNNKKVFWDTKLKYKPHSVEVDNGKKWLDDCEVDYLVAEDLDEVIIELY